MAQHLGSRAGLGHAAVMQDQNAVRDVLHHAQKILAIFAAPDQFQDFLYLIGSVFAPMTAILLSDFFILKQDHTADSVNWLNLVLWVLGVILYRFLLNVDTPVGITVPVVVILMVISALVHKVLNKA